MDALSQQDVDSLLKGAAPRTPPKQVVNVIPYNFRRPPRISRERQKLLEAIHARFGHALQGFLGSRLMQPVTVTIASVEQATFSEFTMALGSPSATYVYDLGEEIGSQAAFDLATDFALYCVDRLFGGPGEGGGLARPITELEQNVLGQLVDRTMLLWREVWGDLLPLAPTRLAFESLAESLRIAAREDNVLIVTIEVAAGPMTGLLTMCVPLVALESFLQEKSGPLVATSRIREAERAAARATVETELLLVHLPLTVRLPVFHLPASVVAGMQPGQVLPTGLPRTTAVEVLVNDRPLFTGQLGRHHGMLAAQLTAALSPELAASPRPRRRTA